MCLNGTCDQILQEEVDGHGGAWVAQYSAPKSMGNMQGLGTVLGKSREPRGGICLQEHNPKVTGAIWRATVLIPGYPDAGNWGIALISLAHYGPPYQCLQLATANWKPELLGSQ